MKNLLIIIICFVIWNCTPDRGNYDYIDLNEVVIEGIQEEYAVNRFSNLTIKPDLKFALDEQGEFRYLWYLYQNSSEKIDTLSTECNVDVPINVLPGKYILVFKVFDVDMDVYYWTSCDVIVQDVLSEGILILGETRDSVSISMINTKGVVSKNIYKGFTGDFLGVNPESIWHFIPSNPGSYKGREYVTVVYDNGKAALFDPLNFIKVMDANGMFVVNPGEIKIEGYLPDYNGADYLINNGKLHHRRYYLEYNVDVSGDQINDYYLSTVSVGKYDQLSGVDLIAFYDKKWQRFLTMDEASANTMKVMQIHKSPNPAFNPANVGLDIKYVYNSGNGWCKGIFADRNTGDLYLLQFQLISTQGMTKMKPQGKKLIAENSLLYDAEDMLMSTQDESSLLFAKGCEIWSYNVNTGEEKMLVDFKTSGKDFEIVKLMEQDGFLIVGLNDNLAASHGGSVRILEIGTLGGSIVLSTIENGEVDGLADKIIDLAYKFMNN